MVNGDRKKMSVQRNITPEDIRYEGLKALADSLGPVGMVQFLQQFDYRKGDYAKERKKWLKDYNVDEIADEINKMKMK